MTELCIDFRRCSYENKEIVEKVSAVLMSAAVLCTGAATVLPQVAESGIEAQAAGNSFASAAQINVNQSYTDSISRKNEVDYYRFTLNSDSKISVSCLHDYVDKNYPFLCLTIYRDNNRYLCITHAVTGFRSASLPLRPGLNLEKGFSTTIMRFNNNYRIIITMK